MRSRLFLILLAGLAVAYGLSFSILFAERYMSAKAVMGMSATSITSASSMPISLVYFFIDFPLSLFSFRLKKLFVRAASATL